MIYGLNYIYTRRFTNKPYGVFFLDERPLSLQRLITTQIYLKFKNSFIMDSHDVLLKCGNEVFPCHKLVLCMYSTKFKELLRNYSSCITINTRYFHLISGLIELLYLRRVLLFERAYFNLWNQLLNEFGITVRVKLCKSRF